MYTDSCRLGAVKRTDSTLVEVDFYLLLTKASDLYFIHVMQTPSHIHLFAFSASHERWILFCYTMFVLVILPLYKIIYVALLIYYGYWYDIVFLCICQSDLLLFLYNDRYLIT